MTATYRLVQTVIFLFVLFCIGTTLSQQLPPRFPSNLYGFIPESQQNGTLITSFNVTDPNLDVITLGIYDNFTRSCVYLNTTDSRGGFVTGNVYLINPDNFDYDRGQRDVRLAFTARDGANTVTGFVHVYVSDVNDNAPEFKRPAYIFEIDENATIPSTYNVNITATDADDGVNKAFVYSLHAAGQSSELYQGVFSIDQNNGNLTLNQTLDYETLNFYQYTIEAEDSGNPAMTGSAEITIKVSDVQDTPPRFQGLPYLYNIKENSSWVGNNILAQDGDRGIPRNITYSLYNDSQCSSLFTLDNMTGKLSLKDGQVLDRDTGVLKDNQGVCRLQITAIEVTHPGQPIVNSTANTTVTVTVDDIDDNVPTFSLSHCNAYVDEEVSSIPLTIDGAVGINVSDLDQDENSEFDLTVNYANGTKYTGIESTPSHIIGQAIVLLRLVNGFKFDYETEEMVELHVVATGRVNNSMSSTCTVTVYINNTNDNDPVFDHKSSDYNATIAENPEHGTSVIVVTAKDDDKGEYGELTYTLKGSTLFAIDPNGTVYTTGCPGDLDRETRDTYYLTVVVTDGGGKRAVASLTVTLSDVNDNWPQFIYTTVEMSINENTTTFTPNILIKANDNDEPGTYNSEVRYKLQIPDPSLQSNFTINDTTGELIATERLDYENLTYPSENGQIRLIVIAYDLGTPPLDSNITVTINAHDENDNTPKFLHDDYNASIPENSKQGHAVITVSAEDEDATSPNNVTRYYIEKGGSDKFRIDAINGIITVDLNARFDRETQDLYILTVIAADIGTPPLTGTVNVSVTITDVNDEDPEFGKLQYPASVKEDIPVGTIIKTCNATDADEDSNLEYIVLGMKATDMNGDLVNTSLIEDMFNVVRDNGSVFVSSELDRETSSQVVITLLVNDTMCAENCPQNDTTTLTVTVEDVNDVAPQFSEDAYEVAIPESYAVGRVVTTLTATDVDITGDGPFYTVVSDPYSSFTIKENRTGTITTTRKLDRETHPFHNITVSASDGVNNSTAIVIINVTDVNDNAPEFLPFDSTVNITERNYTDNNMWVAGVNATDADEGENAVVIYKLQTNLHNFWINESTGDIYAVGDVDREAGTDGKIELTIVAENSDKDPENLRNTTKLTLLILDVNDNPPKFSGTPYHGSGQETEVKNGTFLLQVTATDSDNGLNGTAGITYEIEQNTNGTEFFHINDTSGWIYANGQMVDNVGTFLLNVTSRDGGHPPLMSSVEVFIEIVDENNNHPEFHIEHMFSILECEGPGINITRINATDKDKGLNGKIMFSLIREPGSDPLPFTIGKDNGQISLNKSVTNEEHPEYKFNINATDNGSPTRLTTTSPKITIQIRDVNDRPPQFPQPTRTVNVMENTNDTVVTTVEAYDNDSDSITTYSITNYGHYSQYFKVNKTTGVVTIVKALDRETTPSVKIEVVATDASLRNETCNGTDVKPVAINDTQTLHVVLDDQDDSPPVFKQKVFRTGVRKNVKLDTEIFDFVEEVTDKDSETYSIHSFKIVGDMTMPQKITVATGNAGQCAESKVKRPVCLSSNGTVTTNMLFEEAMEGTITFQVLAWDTAGNDTAQLNIDIIVDYQMAKMVFQGTKQEVENIKSIVTGKLTNLTGMIFVPDEVNVYTRDDGIVDSSRSILTFYVKDPSTGRILTASEIKQLVDRFGNQLISIQLEYRLLSIEEAFKEPVKEENGEFKQKMILAGATILEAIIICILIVVACRSQGKFKRKLKAATVTTKDEKDSVEKKSSIIPGSNVYASITNPILNKDVPLPVMTEIDNMSDTDSQNSLDSNEVGAEGMTPDYRTTEEKEAVMDMYTEDFYTADTDTDPLQMVLAMHEREKAQNGHVTQMHDMEDESEFHLDFDNPALTLETTEV